MQKYAVAITVGMLFLGACNKCDKRQFVGSHNPRYSTLNPKENFMTQSPSQYFAQWLNFANMAPSTHNTKPWRFTFTDNTISCYIDFSKRISIADPGNRELYISVGCALTNCLIAAQHDGFTTTVNYPLKNDLLATITLEKTTQAPNSSTLQLYEAVTKRFTDRNFYSKRPIPSTLQDTLQRCGTTEVHVLLFDGTIKQQIAKLVYTGDIVQYRQPAYCRELANAISKGLLHAGFMSPIVQLVVTYIPIGSLIATREKKLIEQTPLFGVLCAPNTPRGWIDLGQVYETIALTATTHHLHIHPMNQGLTELPTNQATLKKLLNCPHEPLFGFRIGYPRKN